MQTPRDENRISTLIGTSNADGITPVSIYADPVTHRLLVQNNVSNGIGAPASTPTQIGQLYVDTSGKKGYIATGTNSASDWTILN